MKTLFYVVGGSGAGKTTLTQLLKDELHPNTRHIALEDYYKNFDAIPVRFGDRPNLDCPEAFDIREIKNEIISWKKDETSPIAVVEGFIAASVLHPVSDVDNRIIYLDAPHEVRFPRRQGEMTDVVYEKQVLSPMHARYVEPQLSYADYVLDISTLSKSEVLENVRTYISSVMKRSL